MLEGIAAIAPLNLLGYGDMRKGGMAEEAGDRNGRAVLPGTMTRSDLYFAPLWGLLLRV